MATNSDLLDDIIARKNAAVMRLNVQIMFGMGLLRSSSSVEKDKALNDAITTLTQERSEVAIQAYERELESKELKDALNAIQNAEKEMEKVAAKMVTVTGYIKFASSFAKTSATVTAALKKPAKPKSGGSG